MDLLSDDLFHQILSFVPSRRDLANVAMTSSRAFSVIHQSSMPIFRKHWQIQFGTKGDRRSYQSLYYLQQLLKRNSAPKIGSSIRKAGILTAKQEHAALLYDNGSDAASCLGYFGMQLLWDYGPVAVWGDFLGLRIFYGVGGLLDEKARSVVSIGEDEAHVLCVLSVPEKKLFFIGFSSGKVVCIRATWVAKNQYTYAMVSSVVKHSNEVTSLHLLPEGQGLLSASVDGTVYKYPHATTRGDLEEDGTVVCQVGAAVLTMSTLEHRGRTFLLTGDNAGNVTLWWAIDDTEWRHSYSHLQNVPTQSLLWLDGNDLYVIIGDNDGRIQSWRLDDHLELEYMGITCETVLQGWPVECFTVLGDLLLVGAGRKTVAFSLPDVRQGVPTPLGSPLPCHPNAQRPASVVSIFVCHFRQSFVTLCRDGTLHEWSFKKQKEQVVLPKRSTKQQPRVSASQLLKRKRGRPLKARFLEKTEVEKIEKVAATSKQQKPTVKRKRGRPPKIKDYPVPASLKADKSPEPDQSAPLTRVSETVVKVGTTAPVTTAKVETASVEQQSPVKRKIGRPRKNQPTSPAASEPASTTAQSSTIVRDRSKKLTKAPVSNAPANEAPANVVKPPPKKKKKSVRLPVGEPARPSSPEAIKSFSELDRFMKEQATEKEVKAMNMRIVQAGFLYFRNKAPYFMGVNNVFYTDIAQAFDAHSGLSKCDQCDGVYECRMVMGHAKGLKNEEYNEKILGKLLKSKKLSNGAPTLDGWICDKCHTTCPHGRRRCFLCLRWKGGKKGPNTTTLPQKTAVQTPKVPDAIVVASSADDSTVTDTTEISTSTGSSLSTQAPPPPPPANKTTMLKILDWDVDESAVDGTIEKMWTCKYCYELNTMRRFKCTGCEHKGGGPILKVLLPPDDDELPPLGKIAPPPDGLPTQIAEKQIEQQPNSPFRDWQCQDCGVSNDANEYHCAECGLQLHHHAEYKPPPEDQQNNNNNKREALTKWTCRKCTYVNKVGAVSCEVCFTIRRRTNASA